MDGQGHVEDPNSMIVAEAMAELAISTGGGGGDIGEEAREEGKTQMADDEVIEKAQKLMESITSESNNPNPNILHDLSNLLESQESLEMGQSHGQSDGQSDVLDSGGVDCRMKPGDVKLVKTAALEEFKSSGSDKNAVSAATGAATAVIDAAEVSRSLAAITVATEVSITPLPPVPLLHPHVFPERRRLLEAPLNITGRLGTRELQSFYSGVHGNRRDRQFVFSRFKRSCKYFNDDEGLFTGISLLGGTNHLAIGSDTGEVKIFEASSGSLLERFNGHESPVTLVESFVSGNTQLLLSSSYRDVLLWDASSVSSGPRHHFDGFDGCKAAKFSNSGLGFATLSSINDVLLYDVQTCTRCHQLTDTNSASRSARSASRSARFSLVHFSPCDTMVMWNGALWDTRVPQTVRRFDEITDYGGGGFHPSRSEVIINSEVWDMRNFKLLRSVPSLDQTAITFNGRGDVIYAMLRRNMVNLMSAFNSRRVKHPLFAAFRTLDAINYSDIATIPVDGCLIDFATEPTDSFLGLITVEDKEEFEYSWGYCLYEIGRQRPTDDDSDPNDGDERRRR